MKETKIEYDENGNVIFWEEDGTISKEHIHELSSAMSNSELMIDRFISDLFSKCIINKD